MAFFRLRAPARQARPGPPLAPVLGQQQIKVQDFITEFHKQSADYVEGFPLHCRVDRLPGVGKFRLRVAPPTYFVMLQSAAVAGQVTAVDLYTMLVYRGGPPSPSQVRTLLGTVRSCRLGVRPR